MFKDKVQFNWEFFSDHVLKFYTSTYNDPTLADVTLVSDDNIAVSAHKFILSSASPVLRKFFTSSPSSAPQCLFMFGLSNNVLRSILEFIYTGETMVKSEELDAFLKGANNLDLSGVKKPESQPAQSYMNNLNSFQAAQQELDRLLPRSSTPVNKRLPATFEQRGNVPMTAESSPICIDDFSSNNEEGEVVNGDEVDEHKIMNMSQTLPLQPHSGTGNIHSQAKGVKGKVRKEPFSCGICERVFQYRSNLKSHVALKHGNTAT